MVQGSHGSRIPWFLGLAAPSKLKELGATVSVEAQGTARPTLLKGLLLVGICSIWGPYAWSIAAVIELVVGTMELQERD